MSCKVAFLSVMFPANKSKKYDKLQSKHRLCLLNEHVVSSIFAFAALPVLRKVYFLKSDIDEDEDDENE
ncbi:hypothetical protein JG688_00017718 [Phytophthora aleatoria]|uniref:Uncharacterized protein n=1 Tax=Phytophthora aleatoria TaxID=2496075 RepID=A0A8J5ISA9_9STRA|nr:hypothetical protein JG688_00017718 [Phytophthora aleatoria]